MIGAKAMILERLRCAPSPCATHELKIAGYSENNIATRCAEMAKAGQIAGRFRAGRNFKEWFILKSGQMDLEI